MNTRLNNTNPAAALAAILAAIVGLTMMTAGPAGAEEGLEIGPEPIQPVVTDLVFELIVPTATVDVSCDTETATAKLGNKTNNFIPVTIKVDGSTIKSGVVGPDQQILAGFDLAENQTKSVEIKSGTKSYYDKDVTRDCRKPTPSYQVLTNCASGQAHARLINDGDDTAHMAVDYPGAPNSTQPVAAHSSMDWLLDVAPGETVDFSVRESTNLLGSESLAFTCAEPEPPAPEPQPQPQPQPEPQPQPQPQPEPQPQPQPELGDNAIAVPVDGNDDIDPTGSDSEAVANATTTTQAVGVEVEGAQQELSADKVEGERPTVRSGGSRTNLILAILWGSVAAVCAVAILLAWRGRQDDVALS